MPFLFDPVALWPKHKSKYPAQKYYFASYVGFEKLGGTGMIQILADAR